jgi:hypothetical protein
MILFGALSRMTSPGNFCAVGRLRQKIGYYFGKSFYLRFSRHTFPNGKGAPSIAPQFDYISLVAFDI